MDTDMIPPPPEIRLYRLIREAEMERKLAQRKTYWDKYPVLKFMKNVSKRNMISFMFFSYMFLFSTAEYAQIMNFGFRCVIAQMVVTIFIVLSAYSFQYSLKNVKIVYMIPFMSIVMGGLSCYVCLFALVMFAFSNISHNDYLLLAFHLFLLGVTSLVTFSLAKCTDVLWQGFFMMVDLSVHEGLVEKLRTNAFVEEEENSGKKGKKKSGKKVLIAEKKYS